MIVIWLNGGMKRSLLTLFVVPVIALAACGSDDQTTTSTDAAPTTEASVTSEAPTTEPAISVTPPATEAPPTSLMAEPVECVVPASLAVDSDGRPYELSDPLCIGGWLLAYPTNCDMECEGSYALQMVDGEWESRGFIYNGCYEAAVDGGLPEAIALFYVRSLCESEGNELFLITEEPTTGPLNIGHFGPRVRALDLALSEAGFLVEAPNDRFDFETHKAVLDMQFQLDLEVDGYAGPMTLGALGLS